MTLRNILLAFVFIVCLLRLDYIVQIREINKINYENFEKKLLELYRRKERGERFLNVLGVMYVPVVIGMLQSNKVALDLKIVFFLMVTAIIIALNCRIYRYVIRIKQLEIYQPKMV